MHPRSPPSATMPPEFLAKNHISEPPPKTSPAPTPRHISIPCERNQSTKLRCAAGCSLGWRGLRRSGRGLCLLAGRHPGAAWRRRLETSGASSRRLGRGAPAGGCTFLQPPPPLRHRLLLVGRLEMELRRRRLWFAIKVWLPGHNSSSSSAASVGGARVVRTI